MAYFSGILFLVSVPFRGNWGFLQEIDITTNYTAGTFPPPLEVTGVSNEIEEIIEVIF